MLLSGFFSSPCLHPLPEMTISIQSRTYKAYIIYVPRAIAQTMIRNYTNITSAANEQNMHARNMYEQYEKLKKKTMDTRKKLLL